MQRRTSRTFDIILLASLGGLLWWAAANRIAIGDWVYFLTYNATEKTQQVATDAGLSDAGRRLFYRTNPAFVSKNEIESACDIERLGCIDEDGRVYILDEPDKHPQAVVTAAHEMLHLVYRRLSNERKEKLAPLIDQAITMNIAGIQDELKNELNDDDRRDEAHSLLGTEYQDLPSELETYYKQYFADRSKVVAAEADSQ
jgi:hypothetical protein